MSDSETRLSRRELLSRLMPRPKPDPKPPSDVDNTERVLRELSKPISPDPNRRSTCDVA
jgi:hypothetical protein